MTDHKYLSIHKHLFDTIQSSHHDENISLKIISGELFGKDSKYKETEIYVENIWEKRGFFSIIHLATTFRDIARNIMLIIPKN